MVIGCCLDEEDHEELEIDVEDDVEEDLGAAAGGQEEGESSFSTSSPSFSSSSPSLPTSLPVDPAIRKLAESSDIYQNVDINFKEPHDLKLCKEVYDGTKRVKAYSCELCKVKKPNPPISDKNRTKYKCVQCSSVALKASDIVYLHPECFGEYHRRKYRTVLGSSNVKGLVIGT